MTVARSDVRDLRLDPADGVVLVLESPGEMRLALRRVQAREVKRRDGENLMHEERVRDRLRRYLPLPGTAIRSRKGG